MDEATEESKDDDIVVFVVMTVEDLHFLDPEVETEVVVLLVEVDRERFRGNIGRELGEPIIAPALASRDMDAIAEAR